MAAQFRIVMLKENLPTLVEARTRLNNELEQARRAGVRVLKIVHGYGSSGTGGVLRDGIRASLRKRRKEGKIRAFVTGERWDALDETAQQLIQECPEAGRDSDLGRYNEGITLVLI